MNERDILMEDSETTVSPFKKAPRSKF
jgi:hypothetical protein